MKIVCVGGGPAGLYFALLMKQADASHDVVVYERNPPDVTHGWGVTFWDTLLDELRQHDAKSAEAMAAAAYEWSGQDVVVEGKRLERVSGSGYGIDRQALIHLMSERAVEVGVRVEFGREVAPADVIGGADLVVAADGVRSHTRQLHEHDFGARVEPARNQFVWLGTPKVFSSFHYAFVRTEAGWIWWYAYGYSDDRSTVVVECSPETWQGLGLDRMGRQETLDALQRLFAADLDGHPLLAQPRDNDSVGWQSFPVVTNDRWVHGNMALMGDAAHTTHFSIGSGTMLALEDAMTLAGSLQRHPDLATALQEYDTSRRAAVAPTQRDALLSLQWYENVPRYAALGPDRLAAAMHRRRSPLLARTPPALYFALRGAVYNPVTRGLKRRVSALRPAPRTPA